MLHSWRCSTTGGDKLVLVPRDTKGTAAGAADAARAAIAEGVGIILGPLLAAEVEAVKPIAGDAHLNVIAFSTVTGLAGGNTFLMGFSARAGGGAGDRLCPRARRSDGSPRWRRIRPTGI